MRTLFAIIVLVGTAGLVPAPSAAGAPAFSCDGETVTILGTPGDDVLVGTDGDDYVIFGRGGDDVIRGGAGNDVLCGYDGADRLFGEEGDDRLFAGNAHRLREVQNGTQWIPDRLDGGPGNDRLEIGRHQRSRGPGIVGVIAFGSATEGVTVDLAARTATGDGDDRIAWRRAVRVVGTAYDDVLIGRDDGEELLGRGGQDTCLHAARVGGCELTSP